MTIRAVIDTNVLSSGLARYSAPGNRLGEVLRRWDRDAFQLLISDHILGELRATLAKPWFVQHIARSEADHFTARLVANSLFVSLTGQVVGIAPHASDDPILETADVGGARYLVTGNHALLALGRYRDVLILSPADFLAVLEAAEDDCRPVGGGRVARYTGPP